MKLNEWHEAIGVELHDVRMAITTEGWEYYNRAPIGRHFDELERKVAFISGRQIANLLTYLDIPFCNSRLSEYNDKRKFIRQENFTISCEYDDLSTHMDGELLKLECKILAPRLINIRFQVGWFWSDKDIDKKTEENPYETYTTETMTHSGPFSVFWKERREGNQP